MCHILTVRKKFVHFLLKYGKLKTDSVFGLVSWFVLQGRFLLNKLIPAWSLRCVAKFTVGTGYFKCDQLKVQYTLYLQWKAPSVFIERYIYFFSSRVSFGRRQGSFSWPIVLCGKFSYFFSSVFVFAVRLVERYSLQPEYLLENFKTKISSSTATETCSSDKFTCSTHMGTTRMCSGDEITCSTHIGTWSRDLLQRTKLRAVHK